MNYVLKGSISRTQPYQLDPTLTLEGAGAEAKATGEAIRAVKTDAENHAYSTANPHNVTKSQLGLENVDNTSDMDKPISHAQEAAIADAKQTGVFAQNLADEAMAACTANHTFTTEVKTIAENAQTSADEAHTLAQEAKAAADSAVSSSQSVWFSREVTLAATGWGTSNLNQVVDVEGVSTDDSQPLFICPDEDSEVDYNMYGVYPFLQYENQIEFKCKTMPPRSIKVRIVGFTMPETDTE